MLTGWYLFLKCIRNGSMKHTISYVASIHKDPNPLGVIAHNRWRCQKPLDGDVVGAVFKELSVWETASQRSFETRSRGNPARQVKEPSIAIVDLKRNMHLGHTYPKRCIHDVALLGGWRSQELPAGWRVVEELRHIDGRSVIHRCLFTGFNLPSSDNEAPPTRIPSALCLNLNMSNR